MQFPRIMLPAVVALTMACRGDTVVPTAATRSPSAPSSAVIAGQTVHLVSLAAAPYEIGSTLIVVAFEPFQEPVVRFGITYVGYVRAIQTGVGGPGQILYSDTALEPGTMLTTTTADVYPNSFEATVVLHGSN
jgi:hypothetical protein